MYNRKQFWGELYMLNTTLKCLRVANELSQKEASIKIGMSAAQVSDLESGKKKPSLNALTKYSETFNIPVSRILKFDEMQNENGWGYQELLKNILMYYVYETGDKDMPMEKVK